MHTISFNMISNLLLKAKMSNQKDLKINIKNYNKAMETTLSNIINSNNDREHNQKRQLCRFKKQK